MQMFPITLILGKIRMNEETEKLYVIWSIEHQAWWKQTKCGYVEHISDAGHFPFTESEHIVKLSNLIRTEEIMIPINQITETKKSINFRK